jgi:hypothetical protein
MILSSKGKSMFFWISDELIGYQWLQVTVTDSHSAEWFGHNGQPAELRNSSRWGNTNLIQVAVSYNLTVHVVVLLQMALFKGKLQNWTNLIQSPAEGWDSFPSGPTVALWGREAQLVYSNSTDTARDTIVIYILLALRCMLLSPNIFKLKLRNKYLDIRVEWRGRPCFSRTFQMMSV